VTNLLQRSGRGWLDGRGWSNSHVRRHQIVGDRHQSRAPSYSARRTDSGLNQARLKFRRFILEDSDLPFRHCVALKPSVQLLIFRAGPLLKLPEASGAFPAIDGQKNVGILRRPQQLSAEIAFREPKQLCPIPIRTVGADAVLQVFLSNGEFPDDEVHKGQRCRRLGRGNTVLQWAFSAFGAYRLADLPGSFCPSQSCRLSHP